MLNTLVKHTHTATLEHEKWKTSRHFPHVYYYACLYTHGCKLLGLLATDISDGMSDDLRKWMTRQNVHNHRYHSLSHLQKKKNIYQNTICLLNKQVIFVHIEP